MNWYRIATSGQINPRKVSMAGIKDPRETMPVDEETELLLLLAPEQRSDIKALALQHMLGMTGSEEGRTYISERAKLFSRILELMFDPNHGVGTEAEKCVLNLASDEKVVEAMLGEGMRGCTEDAVRKLLERTWDVDKSCNLTFSIINNITRVEDGAGLVAKVVMETESLGLERLVDNVTTLYEKKGMALVTTCTLLMNLTQVTSVRQALMMAPKYLLLRLLALMSLSSSSLSPIRGVVGAIKNCCFEYEFHTWLLNEENNLLARILLPLAGPEEFDEEDMDRLPLDLQYLPADKERETDAEIRLMLVQAVHKLCSTKAGRQYVKDKNAYVIMRELHKAESSDENIDEIMNVIDILIGNEPEEGMEDLHKVDVPEKWKEKFEEEGIKKEGGDGSVVASSS